MNRSLLTTTLCSLSLLAPAAAAHADEYHGYDQQPGLAKCFWSVKKVQKLSDVARHGVAYKGQCDRDTQIVTTMSFAFESKADDDWARIHSGGIPGLGKSGKPMVRGGVPFSFRARYLAAKFTSRYPKVRVHMMFYRRGTVKPDRYPSLDRGQDFTIVNDVRRAKG